MEKAGLKLEQKYISPEISMEVVIYTLNKNDFQPEKP
jgi:hypothetical protein